MQKEKELKSPNCLFQKNLEKANAKGERIEIPEMPFLEKSRKGKGKKRNN